VILQPNGGNVGIGTKTPAYALEVIAGSSYTSNFMRNPTDVPLSIYSDSIGGGFATRSSIRNLIYITPNTSTKFYGNSVAVVTINDNGNVSFGSGITASQQVDLSQNIRIRGLGAGTVYADSNGVLYTTSDEKTKSDIKYISESNLLSKIKSLKPASYVLKSDGQTKYGFIAGDVKSIIPEAVSTKQDGEYKQVLKTKGKMAEEDVYESVFFSSGTTTDTLDDRAIIAVLVQALKEEDAKVEAMQLQLNTMQKQIDELKLAKQNKTDVKV
jgi:hypothetical protein